MRSRTIKLDGQDGLVHYADYGGSGPPLVLVHGLGGSHLNWMAVAPLLAARCRVLALDLPGFGRSPPTRGRPLSLSGHQAALEDFIDRCPELPRQEPVLLMGNSMGALISLMAAAARPERTAGLVLISPAVPAVLGVPVDPGALRVLGAAAVPVVGPFLLRRRMEQVSPEIQVQELMSLCFEDTRRLPREVRAAHEAMARDRSTLPWSAEATVRSTRSVLAALFLRSRHSALLRSVRAPVLHIHGARDRLIPLALARAAARVRPDWTYEFYDGVGHTAQLEAPERVSESFSRWLARLKVKPATER